jgi:hypothetical protein
LNICKNFCDGLDEDIRKGMEAKGVFPPDAIPTNTIALATLAALKREAEVVEKENARVTTLVQRAVSKGGTNRANSGRAQMLIAPASRSPRAPPARNRDGEWTDLFNYDQHTQEEQAAYPREYRGANQETAYKRQVTAYNRALAAALGQTDDMNDRVEGRREDEATQGRTGFALLSIAERAMRDASNTNSPLSCWGCGDPHLFSQCPLKNDPAVIARFRQKLETWKAEGGTPRTRLLSANQLKFSWENLGFESKQQALNLLTIMQSDTPMESRQSLLKQFKAKAMMTKTTTRQAHFQEEDEEDSDNDGTQKKAARRTETNRSGRKRSNTLTFICRPRKPVVSTVKGFVLKSSQKSKKKSQFRLTAQLPHIALNIGEGEEDDPAICLKGALDTCAGGTIGYRPYHDSIREHYPHLVKDYLDFKKEGIPFYEIGGIEEDGEGVQVSAEITYFTPYIVNGLFVDFVVGLSDETSANTIYGLPIQTQTKFVIDLEESTVHSAVLRESFPVTFEEPSRTDSIIPQDGLLRKVLMSRTSKHKEE